MSNTIQLAKKYVPLLDEVYKASAKSSILDSDASMVREGANTNEIVIPKISMDGLADYDRNTGYVGGETSLTWETVAFNFDRGRMFTVDSMDNEESVGLAFGRLASEFIRTKVTPEIDAFRFATYAGTTGISSATPANLTSGEAVIQALRAAADKMDEDEVTEEGRHLFITPTLMGMIDDLDTTKSKAVLSRFASITKVPQSRFYTAIEQKDGKTSGEEAGGYTKAAGAKNINFLIVEKSAAIQFEKHVVPKIISPEQNQTADAWKFGYRNYAITDVYENKVAGIYCHAATI